MKALKMLNSFIHNVCTVLAILMTALVIFQVLARYVLKLPLAQVEELSRYAMIWVALLGSTIGIRNKSHVAVNFLMNKLPEKIRKVSEAVVYLLIIMFCGILMVYGWEMISRTIQRSTSMPWLQIKYIMAVVPLTGLIGILYCIELLFDVFRPASGSGTAALAPTKEEN